MRTSRTSSSTTPSRSAVVGDGAECSHVRWETVADCRHCAIRHEALFGALRGPDFEHIFLPIRRAVVPAGETIYREDSPAAAVYTLSRGLIKLIKGVNGSGRIVRLLGPGAAVGLEALSTGLHWHTAVALRKSELCRIPLDVFRELRQHNLSVTDRVVGQWEQQVKSADRWLAELNHGTVAERVRRLLAVLAEMAQDDHSWIELPPMSDMASILGTTRESVSRTVAELKRTNALRRVAPHTYEIDREALPC